MTQLKELSLDQRKRDGGVKTVQLLRCDEIVNYYKTFKTFILLEIRKEYIRALISNPTNSM